MALITIMMPVYNVENYISRCLDSIISQTFKDFDVILVDDGSSDKSGEICDKYALKDSRFNVIHNKNSGVSFSRNCCLDWAFKNSDSKWLNFVDSDDFISPVYLEYLYKTALEFPDCLSVCSYLSFKDNDFIDNNIPSYTVENIETENFFCKHRVNSVTPWAKLYPKNVFANIRYPYGKVHEDELITYRIIFSYKNIAFVNLPLYNYFLNDNGITGSVWNPKRLSVLKAIRMQKKYFKKNNYKNAYLFLTVYYLSVLCDYIYEINNLDKYKIINCMLKAKLFFAYILNQKTVDNSPVISKNRISKTIPFLFKCHHFIVKHLHF